MFFEQTTLGKVSKGGKGNYGIAAAGVDYSDELYTYLRITDIKDDGTINACGLKSVNDEKAANYLLKPNDIVFARTGANTGRNYFYDGSDGQFVYAGFLIKFSLDPDKVNPKYVKYYCLSREYKEWITSYSTGSTRGNINAQTLAQMPLLLPERKQQDKMVDILSSIDRKIKENEKINKNLIQQSQALYSAWFEQFLPFGGSMPSDWHIGTLGDIATIKTNSFNPQKNPGVMLEHYSIPAYDEQHFPVFEPSDNVKSNKYILTDNSVLASKLNPDTKRIWRPMCLTDHAVCSTEFIVFEANNSAYKDFLFSIIDSQSFSDWMCAHTTGSTNSRQRTTPSTTLEFKVPIASDDVIDEFCASVTPMYDLVSQNLQENQRLASLRDSLLPKLMSGETDVSDVDL